MSGGLTAAAIARRDGSKSDGIHVLLTPPATAGWSIDRWDVQRRKASGRQELRCNQLSAAELDALDRILRLGLTFAEIRLRQTDCPAALPALPDDPVERPIAGPQRSHAERGTPPPALAGGA